MNTINYRWWDKSARRMLLSGADICGMYVDGAVIEQVRWDGNRTVSGRVLAADSVVCMLFIGVCDANGKQIFEGDIVKTRSGRKAYVGALETINDVDRWRYAHSVVVSNVYEEDENGHK